MERRGFLKGLALLSAGAVLDPERLLWIPGKKTIFVPPPETVFHFSGLRPRYWLDQLNDDLCNPVIERLHTLGLIVNPPVYLSACGQPAGFVQIVPRR